MTEREIPPLPDATILWVEVGSTAHGTGLPGKEDRDEMAVVVEPASTVLGPYETGGWARMDRTQPDGVRSGPDDTDRQIYSLRRFLRLAVAGNPSILIAFWAPEALRSGRAASAMLWGAGEELRELAPAFVGRHVLPRYLGYMSSQVARTEGQRGGRHGRFRDDPAGWDTKYAMHAARLGFQAIELMKTRRLRLPIEGEPGEWLRALRRGEVPRVDWLLRCADLQETISQLRADESIPAGPDIDLITQWSVRTHMYVWRMMRLANARRGTGFVQEWRFTSPSRGRTLPPVSE